MLIPIIVSIIVIAGIIMGVIYYIKNSCRQIKQVPFNDLDFNKDDLDEYAKEISLKYREVKNKGKSKSTLECLNKSFDEIVKTYEILDKEVKERNEIVPAGEWLLDNLYLIEKEYKHI
ncbi:MAG: hypothetical protein ACERKV_13575, partial [Clostridiaceae bacterium]